MSILIATPCYGGQVTEHYLSSMIKLTQAFHMARVEWDLMTLRNESLITRARNTCVARFLQAPEYKDYSHLMFIDADIQFTPDDVARLWNLQAENDWLDVCAGCYRIKKPDSQYALWVDGALVTDLDQFDGPVEVDYAGTGFMLIRRIAFERLIDLHPEIEHEEGQVKKSWAIFDTGVVDNVYLSEDYWFCKQWRAAGGKILADPKVRLKHVGQFVYE